MSLDGIAETIAEHVQDKYFARQISAIAELENATRELLDASKSVKTINDKLLMQRLERIENCLHGLQLLNEGISSAAQAAANKMLSKHFVQLVALCESLKNRDSTISRFFEDASLKLEDNQAKISAGIDNIVAAHNKSLRRDFGIFVSGGLAVLFIMAIIRLIGH